MDWTRDFAIESGYPTDADVTREQNMVVRGEDVPMVEAQQRNRDLLGDLKDIPAHADRLLGAVHRMRASLLKRQRGEPESSMDRQLAEGHAS